MPHQHHFLSRLDRVSLPHVELALHLYREHELVRFILERVRLPDAAERVALSLGDPECGPFVVVTREGRFVTCLAEGMTVANLPVVTKGQLDGIAAKHSDLKRRMETCQNLVGPGQKTSDLLGRIYEAGDELSREEFIGISAMEPLLTAEFMRLQIQAVKDLNEDRLELLRVLKRTDQPKSLHRPLFLLYWKTFWALLHLTVLGAMSGRECLEPVGEKLSSIETAFSSCTFRQGIVASAVRGVWAAARIGKMLLPNYKQAYARAHTSLELLESGMVLAALGLRHAKLRAEVRKTLHSPPQFDDSPAGKYLTALADAIVKFSDLAFDDPEDSTAYHRAIGARMAVRLTEHLPAGSAIRFTRGEDVPLDLALALAVNNRAEFLDSTDPLAPLFTFLPWLAKTQAENLYLPRDFIQVIRRPWTPDRTIVLLRGFTKRAETLAKVPRDEGPSRKGPCPCGSGKKYKRCCGQ